jgi:hypothetical protein
MMYKDRYREILRRLEPILNFKLYEELESLFIERDINELY